MKLNDLLLSKRKWDSLSKEEKRIYANGFVVGATFATLIYEIVFILLVVT